MTDPQGGRAPDLKGSMLTPLHDTTPSTIVAVEDDPITFALLRAVVESAGHRFLGVATARGVHELLPQADLVLLDVMLGDGDGWEICRTIKTSYDPLLPVIMVTGRTAPADIVKTFDSGADDYVAKPFQAQELLARIGSRLRVRNAEAALLHLYHTAQGAEARYRSLFDNNPHPLIVYDRDTLKFLAANNAACALYGYTREEFLKLSVRDIRAPEDAELVEKNARTPLPTLTAKGVWRQRRKDGRMVEVDLNAHDIAFEDYNARLVLALDVTESRAAERAVREAENRLREVQRLEAVGRLAGGVAHDFNNLLTAILGNTDEILRDLPGEMPLRTQIEEIRATAERAARLTRQLLAYGRRQILHPQQLDLNDIVLSLEPLVHASVGDAIGIGFALAAQLPRVLVDPQQIRQVLLNLVANAAEAMQDGGQLTIGTGEDELDADAATRAGLARPGRYVRLEVIDTGGGMQPSVATRALEPFFTTKQQGRGSGLGLSTAYGIVHQSGGTMTIDTEPGRGTSVRVLLPVADALAAAELANITRQSNGTGRTVLLAEDEPSVRSLTKRILERSGYEVLEAANGAEALEVARDADRLIDLLVTDVVMPVLGGRELATALALEQPDVRILFISGYNEEAIQQHGVLLPGSEFLAKPFSPDALRQKVRDILQTPDRTTT
jgi:two-component system, cell cycle sensor histidine kinase and response regulator CckA